MNTYCPKCGKDEFWNYDAQQCNNPLCGHTYVMEFICDNCNFRYTQCIPFGKQAKGWGSICPYCGNHDLGNFQYRNPNVN